jgi:hypothetical protein
MLYHAWPYFNLTSQTILQITAWMLSSKQKLN